MHSVALVPLVIVSDVNGVKIDVSDASLRHLLLHGQVRRALRRGDLVVVAVLEVSVKERARGQRQPAPQVKVDPPVSDGRPPSLS